MCENQLSQSYILRPHHRNGPAAGSQYCEFRFKDLTKNELLSAAIHNLEFVFNHIEQREVGALDRASCHQSLPARETLAV